LIAIQILITNATENKGLPVRKMNQKCTYWEKMKMGWTKIMYRLEKSEQLG